MTDSPTNSIKSEPITQFSYGPREPSMSYESIDGGSIETILPSQSDPSASNEPAYELFQGYSAPSRPFYINMGANEHNDDVPFVETSPSTNRTAGPLSRSLAAIDVDHPQGIPIPTRSNYHNHHHFSHNSQTRNRYPYLQRSTSVRAFHRMHVGSLTTSNGPSHVEQRAAFRRAYFAVRRPRIPKAPPMPKNLLFVYKKNLSSTPMSDNTQQQDDESDVDEEQPPSKSFWVILRLVMFFFAIEFMYAVETALTIPILTSLRVDEEYFSMAWVISPILGFFLQPIVGMWSDSCRSRWGRRRPFILAFAIGAYIGVALLLNAHDLGAVWHDPTEINKIPLKSVIITIVGVTLLDFCADSADAPIRAYLIDTTNPSDQERGFNIHAILGGCGGVLGFSIGALHMPDVVLFYEKGGEFTIIFIVVTLLFVGGTVSTLTSIREEPLMSSSCADSDTATNVDEEEESDEIDIDEKRSLLPKRSTSSRSYNTNRKSDYSMPKLFYKSFNNEEGFVEIDAATGTHIPHDYVEETNENILLQTLELSHQIVAASISNNDMLNPVPVPSQAFNAELKQKAKLVRLGLMRRSKFETTDDDDRDNVTLKAMLVSMVRMPPRLWKLMICQVIGWIAYFASHMYFTDFMAKEVYYGAGTIDSTTGKVDDAYKRGVTMGCWGLCIYAASSAVYAFCMERWLTEKFSLNTLYFMGYFIYALGCIVNYYIHNVIVNIIMCFTFGIMVVTLNTLPYYMLSNFHTDETYKNKDGSKRGIGVDCSLLNSCYFLGELMIAASLGPIVEKATVNSSMLVGAVCSLFGNLCMCFLFYFTN